MSSLDLAPACAIVIGERYRKVPREPSDQWTLGAEVFHRTEQVAGQGASSGFNIAGSFNPSERHHILFSLGKGLTTQTRSRRTWAIS